MSNKRAWKLQEFLAHTSPVSCLTLGTHTGRVMATGGEDKRVNLWAVGKPKCIMGLSGHTAPLDCVNFNHNEDHIMAGTRSGSLKLWNLEASKAVRALSGHMASVTCIDFHPVQSDYVASGCKDSNIKIWDIRRKGCLFTYKGHRGEINDVKFSPDGKWIASASSDGSVKIWGLDKGTLLHDFKQHQSSVNCLVFHPNEFILASGSTDRTVKFYDLENFVVMGSTDSDSTSVRSLIFHPDGLCIFAGCMDNLKIYGFEPITCFDTVAVSWSNVAKVSLTQSQLVGASFSHNTVQTYVVDLRKCKPIYQGPVIDHYKTPTPPRGAAAGSSNEPPSRDYPSQSDNTKPSAPPSIPTDATYSADTNATAAIAATAASLSKNDNLRRSHRRFDPVLPGKDVKLEIKEETPDPSSNPDTDDDVMSVADIQEPNAYVEIFNPSRSLCRTPPNCPLFEEPADDMIAAAPPKVVSKPGGGTPGRRASQQDGERGGGRQPRQTKRQVQHTLSDPARNQPRNLVMYPPAAASEHKQHPDNKPQIDVKDFLPKGNFPRSSRNTQSLLTSKIKDNHHLYSTSLEARCQNLQVVRTMWSNRDTRSAVSYCVSMMDDSVIIDVLKFMCSHQDLWTLEIATLVLPSLEKLVASKYEQHVMTACQAVKVILHHFSTLIKSTLQYGQGVPMVDISKEERYNRCTTCYSCLLNIEKILQQRATKPLQGASKTSSVPNEIKQALMLLRCLHM